MIAVIDYNAGNLGSITNALKRFGLEYEVTYDAKKILAADKVIFPGQGRAGSAMRSLRELGLDAVIPKIKAPFLGICLGMQILLPFSEEDGTECLGIILGSVRKFTGEDAKVPQIGWNTVMQTKADPLFDEIPDVLHAYFVNSYYVDADPVTVLAKTEYGKIRFASVVRKDNFYGTQFHPEKSGEAGLRILENFCRLGEEREAKTFILPAIDLIDGKCVRLSQGDYSKQTTYSDDPIAVARLFESQGASWLHVVDLQGANDGRTANAETVLDIVRSVSIPTQAGGGIKTVENAKRYLDGGVERLLFGTSALENPQLIQGLLAEYGPGRIAVSVDIRDGKVAVKGWMEDSEETVEVLLEKLSTWGVTTVVYTDITSDGMLQGPNWEAVEKMLAAPLRWIIAGGVSSAKDIGRLNRMGAYGVIVGKALYERKVDLGRIIATLPKAVVVHASVKPAETVTKRVIACMDIADGRVVKGTNFKKLRDMGDAVEMGADYAAQGADELVFLDINATVEGRKTLLDLVWRVAERVSIPFTVGGGIRSLGDIRNLLNAGADKVSIGSAAITDPGLVSAAVMEFGSQCIVISVDPKRKENGRWEIFIHGGRDGTGMDALEFCRDMERRGVGELLVNSLDRDGTGDGYDLGLLRAVSEAVSIPVIASSGAGSLSDFLQALEEGKADAVLGASLFHSGTVTIPDLKRYLSDSSIPMRL